MGTSFDDRRGDRRYDICLPLRYRLLRGNRVLAEGTGTTTNLSRGGLAFTAQQFLPSGLSVQIWLEWPILYRGRDRILLRVTGRVLRCYGEEVAVRTSWHEFVREEAAPRQHDAAHREPALVA